MAAALPYIATAMTAYSAVQAGKTPKLPKVADMGDPDSLVKKRTTQRETQKKYGATGRAGTLLSGSGTLG
jgi:hypothetical protein